MSWRFWVGYLTHALIAVSQAHPINWGLRDYGSNGQMGLEPTLEEYIGKMTAVFREVRRVLKDTGTLWLNMGDAYNSGSQFNQHSSGLGDAKRYSEGARGDWPGHRKIMPGLKPKDLIGQPWRLAFALQADGWYLRSDIIWAKPNPMPESVTDRPTKSHEYVFLMSKQAKYFYDAEAIKEGVTGGAHARGDGVNPKAKTPNGWDQENHGRAGYGRFKTKQNESFSAAVAGVVNSRNKRTVWTIATQSYPEAHFATFPEKLVEPCIRAGTSERGYCAECGLPWVRVVEKDYSNPGNRKSNGRRPGEGFRDMGVRTFAQGKRLEKHIKTIGWQPTCSCSADTVPGLVLDPFFGSGTVGVVAAQNGRNWLGIELNPEYIKLAKKRIPTRQEQLIF